ncbi:MAG TPA: hypothetical protein PKG54_18550 [Phycisphaerae bacterium]|jgi:hypothetical protein|nr:hypothetical protein [Phycisphaerae bacterium]HOB76514.1 hypothetical protein [Phycisphaerae bacterium]HOJ56068.1 hypothetical protein [Phycisphaerae bacterium]HOL28302.1 hypothetical protein [Phycisphaerae bacterium]HPP22776.1 hypothetical protein [Phycisphaerae bacterium]
MRLGVAVVMALLVPAWAGCSSHPESPSRCVIAVPEQRPAVLASALLFDPQPGHYDPQDFAMRSDWPSTPSFYSPGEAVYYSDRVVDYQGRPWSNWQGTYRRADSVRIGVGYRP